MATTTNYGWTTPNDTDLVKDGASAIRTLGSSIDTTTKALNPSTTLGDIEYRSATANTNTRLGIGSTGQVLTVASGVPSWATPTTGGGGKVLQVVHGKTLTTASTTSTSYSDTNLTATITPTLNTSKILVIVNQIDVNKTPGDISALVNLQLLRGSSSVLIFSTASGYTGASNRNTVSVGATYLDSPATTSATTYKTQFSSGISGQTVYCQYLGDSYSTITLMEIGA
jgi:hypothetical protein